MNADGAINVIDMGAIQQAILGISEDGIASSWVYPTSTSLNQLSTPDSYETQYDFSDILPNTFLDFIAIKVGDVNITSQDYDKTLGSKNMEIADVRIAAGEVVNVPVFIEDINDMLTTSFALKFNTEAISVTGLTSGSLDISANKDYTIDHERGILNSILINLNTDKKLEENKPAFNLKVEAKMNLKGISNAIKLTSDKVDNEVFTAPTSLKSSNPPASLEIDWTENSTPLLADFATLVSANPLQNEIVLEITSKYKQKGTFTIFDITGKLIHTQLNELAIGVNRVEILKNQSYLPTGAYILNVQDEKGREVAIKLIKN